MKYLLTITLLMSFTSNIWACSCGPWDAQGVMNNADGVYIAIPMEDSEPVFNRWPIPIPRRLKYNRTQMKIVKSFKGSNSDTLNIYHEPQVGTSCEFNFEAESATFVVITYRRLGREFTEFCSASPISPNNSMVTNFLLDL